MSPKEVMMFTGLLFFGGNLFGFVYSMLVLKTNIFAKYRIQKTPYKKGVFMNRLPLYLFNFFVLGTFGVIGSYLLYDLFDLGTPSIWLLLGQIAFVAIIDDIWFYFMHRYLHSNKYLLKKIHSIHHRAHTPFPLEYLYVHPFEWMLGALGPFMGYMLIIVVMPLNIWAFWGFVLFRNLHEIHIHSDLNIPILKWVPFISPVEDHDVHHAKLDGNYASTFRMWDWIMNTRFKQ
ncbi:MAG: sterol desaturase family protein [Crocinitomicaceae bacterium]